MTSSQITSYAGFPRCNRANSGIYLVTGSSQYLSPSLARIAYTVMSFEMLCRRNTVSGPTFCVVEEWYVSYISFLDVGVYTWIA